MYWKGMRNSVQSYVKSCRSFQINKRHTQKYGSVPPELVTTTPWWVLCVNLNGPYTLKGKEGTWIDFMCLNMIDPATSWFKIAELPTVTILTVPTTGKGTKITCNNNTKESEMTFDKSSAQISNLVYKTWFSRYPCCWYLLYNNESNFKLYFLALCNTHGIKSESQPVSRTHNLMLYWMVCMLLLWTIYTQLQSIWLIQWNPVTSMSFYQKQHGPLGLPTIQYSKSHQVQQYLDKACSLTFPS